MRAPARAFILSPRSSEEFHSGGRLYVGGADAKRRVSTDPNSDITHIVECREECGNERVPGRDVFVLPVNRMMQGRLRPEQQIALFSELYRVLNEGARNLVLCKNGRHRSHMSFLYLGSRMLP